jgi:hypothetical protein
MQTYKEKAKKYYLGMKNNWVGTTNIKNIGDYKLGAVLSKRHN